MDGRGYNSLLSHDQVKIQLKFIHSFLFLVPFSANENKISLPISVGTSCLRSFFLSLILLLSQWTCAHDRCPAAKRSVMCGLYTSRCMHVRRKMYGNGVIAAEDKRSFHGRSTPVGQMRS